MINTNITAVKKKQKTVDQLCWYFWYLIITNFQPIKLAQSLSGCSTRMLIYIKLELHDQIYNYKRLILQCLSFSIIDKNIFGLSLKNQLETLESKWVYSDYIQYGVNSLKLGCLQLSL